MNRKRGKILTGEFRNEVLHFGKLITKDNGLIFFSAKIGSEVNPQCLAVVLDEYSKEKERELTVGAYAQKINSLSEECNLISPIVELGMAPDDKPFFISDEVIGSSLDGYKFLERVNLSTFFKKFRDAFLKLEEGGIDVCYIDSKSIYVDSNHPLVFPAVRSLIGEEISEGFLGSSKQKKSYRVFKYLLANSLYFNRHIFGDFEILESRLMELDEHDLYDFISALEELSEEANVRVAPNETFDLNSIDEVEEFSDTNTFVLEEPPLEPLSRNEQFTKLEIEDSDEELTGAARAIKIAKKFRTIVKPILLRTFSAILSFLWALPPKMKIGLGVGIVIFAFITFGESSKSDKKIPSAREIQTEVDHAEVTPSDKIPNVPVESIKLKESPTQVPVPSPVDNDVAEDLNENAETEINTSRDRAEGMRSQQTMDDLAAIQNLQGPLKDNQIKVLVKLTKTHDFEVRIASIRTLGEKAPKGNEEVKASLVDSLMDQDYLVRGFAVSSLTAYLEADSVPILEAHREREESEIVISAIDRAIKRLETYKKRR